MKELFENLGYSYRNACQKYYDMTQRCTNPNYKQFSDYGGRGICVLITKEEFLNWLLESLKSFRQNYHVGSPSVNRIDNDGPYSLDNMSLVTRSQNSKESATRNKGESKSSRLKSSDVVLIRDLCGEGRTQREVASMFKISQTTVSAIVRRINWNHL